MKIYNKPKIYCISEPNINWSEIHKYLSENGLTWTEFDKWNNTDTEHGEEMENTNGDILPEFAGRICYVSFGHKQGRKSNKEYLDNILVMGHGSVLEHANYSFLITNVSRGFTHELVRHRAGCAYSQESTHYIDYNEESGKFNVPKDFNNYKSLDWRIKNAAQFAFKAYEQIYEQLIKSGMKKKQACSIARQILPIGIESKIVYTANIRALRHFIQMRGNKNNVQEIRDVAVIIYDIMKEKAPHCFSDMSKVNDDDNKESIISKYLKI